MPVGILYVDNAFYFNAGPKTRKARNIARNPNCVITIATHNLDLVVEGPATKIVDSAGLKRSADAYAKVARIATAVNGGLAAKYSAPSVMPPPWHVYELRPEIIF